MVNLASLNQQQGVKVPLLMTLRNCKEFKNSGDYPLILRFLNYWNHILKS